MQQLFVSSERFVDTGGTVTAISAQLAGEITRQRGVLDDIRAGWQSDQAAPAFAGAMAAYLDEAAALKDALAGHGDALTSSGRRFAEAETAVAEAMPAVAG